MQYGKFFFINHKRYKQISAHVIIYIKLSLVGKPLKLLKKNSSNNIINKYEIHV